MTSGACFRVLVSSWSPWSSASCLWVLQWMSAPRTVARDLWRWQLGKTSGRRSDRDRLWSRQAADSRRRRRYDTAYSAWCYIGKTRNATDFDVRPPCNSHLGRKAYTSARSTARQPVRHCSLLLSRGITLWRFTYALSIISLRRRSGANFYRVGLFAHFTLLPEIQ